MSKYKLELSRKTTQEKVAMGSQHLTSSGEEPALTFYPVANRKPTDAQMQTAQDNLSTAATEADNAETLWKQKNVVRSQREVEWDALITARAAHFESVTPKNLEALSSTGLPLRNTPSPIGHLPAPADLRAKPRAGSGEVDLRCRAVKGAKIYEWEFKPHDDPNAPWQKLTTTTGANYRATGLTPGTLYAFQVRAFGAAGPGDWSDEAVCRAP